MTVTNWNVATINGKQFLVIDVAKMFIPLEWDPSSNMFLAVAAPDGALGNFAALIRGDTGPAPTIALRTFTPLQPTDPTPDSFAIVQTGATSYVVDVALHIGRDGAPGTSVLNPLAYGTPANKKILIVVPNGSGGWQFVYQTQKVADSYYPTAIANVPAGNPTYTLCPVPIPALDFDYRPRVRGYGIVTGTGADVTVDLVARLNSATGNEVGRAPGVGGVGPAVQSLYAGPPPGSADSFDRVLAGTPATVYFTAERQSGSQTFTIPTGGARFAVKPEPIP